jgi:photosystem II stability/assembly factor-like uncharacterized protein
MINVSKRIVGFFILAFLASGMVACRQNIPASQTPLEHPPPATTTQDSPTVVATPPDPTPHREIAVIPDQWQRLDTAGGGGQVAIATHPTDPDVVYMASDNGGLFKTENGGDDWFSISSNLGAYRLGFVILDPLDPDVIYVTASTDYGILTQGGATGEIHRSRNGGLSWEFVTASMGFQSSFPTQTAIAIPHDPTHPGHFDQDGDNLSDVIIVGAWTGPADPPVGGIWRSQDEGQTFTHLAFLDQNVTALHAFAGDANLLFATTYEGQVYRSKDLGEHWDDITGNMPLASLEDLAVHPTDQDTLYVTCRWCQAGQSPVWKTTDGGQSWKAAGNGLNTDKIEGFPRILIDRFDSDTLYVTSCKAPADIGGVYKSTDGGNSWHLMPYRLVLPDGRPYHWYQFEGKLSIGQAIDGRLFSGDGGGWRYPDGDPDDGREEWEPATLGVGNIHVNTIEVDPFDPTVLYQGISDFGPYKSVNRGSSFHRILGNGWPVTVDNFTWDGPYYSNYRKCWLACSLECESTGRLTVGGTTDFAISKQDSNIVYSAFGSGSGQSQHGGVDKSTDGGKTWQPVGFQLKQGFELNPETCTPYGFRHLAIDSSNDDVLFATMEIPTTGTGQLYKTTDGGATWTKVYSTPIYIKGLEVSAVDPNLVVFATWSNVYKSERGGDPGSWHVITPPQANGFLTIGLSPHQAQVYVVGTNNQGIYYTADGGEHWSNPQLDGLFEGKLYQNSDQFLPVEVAAAFNPQIHALKNISAIVFDPIAVNEFYIAGTRYNRASFGVAKITHAGQYWQRLPLQGLSHRNVYDLAIDASGEFLYAGTFDGTFRFKLR